MKKLLYTLFISALCLAACNGTNKTGGATTDSSASHGNSGPADTTGMSNGSTGTSQQSTGGTDTSTTGGGQ